MRVWVVAAVVCSSLLAIGSTEVLLLWSKPEPHGPYSSLSLMTFPISPTRIFNSTEIMNRNATFCPHPELLQGAGSRCIQLSDSTLSGALPGGTWPASTPSTACKIPAGWVLTVNFVDGTQLVYGPCTQPSSIIQLHEWLLEYFPSS